MFAFENARVEILSRSIPIFCKDLNFLAKLRSFDNSAFTAKYYESAKRPTECVLIILSNKKEKLGRTFFLGGYVDQQV